MTCGCSLRFETILDLVSNVSGVAVRDVGSRRRVLALIKPLGRHLQHGRHGPQRYAT